MSRITRIAVTMLEKEQDIGAPPEPPDEDEGEGNDEEGWDFESLKKKFALKAQAWAEISPNVKKINQLVANQLFSTRPTVKVTHVNFPSVPDKQMGGSSGWAQVEWEWFLDDSKWGEMDDQIEVILKRSQDLAKVFGIVPEQVWNVVDKGEVYEFLLWMITIVYTVSLHGKPKKNTLQSAVGFGWYETVEANRAKYERNLKAAIIRRMPKRHVKWFQSKGITTPEVKFEEPTRQKPSLFGQKYGDQWWGKAVSIWMFSFPQASESESRQSSYTLPR